MNNKEYLISLVSSVLNNKKPENPPHGVDFWEIYELAKAHSVTEILSYAVDSLEIKPSEEFCERMRKEQMSGIMKEVYQDNVLSSFFELCTEAKIPHMPLKGSVTKTLYPHAYLRNMCDMDILVKESDLDRAGKLLEKLGLVYELSGTHDRSYKKPPFVCVELHFKMSDTRSNVVSSEYYESVWSLAHPKSEGEYLYLLNESDFFVFLIEHLCKHYRYAGVGIKPYADVYLYLKENKDKIDMDYVDSIFEKFGIKKFAHHVINLANKWFGDGEGDELSDEMANYVLSSGAFGYADMARAAREVRSQKRGEKKRSRFGYYITRIFPPYRHMCISYPSLRGKGILLPFYWVYRWFERLISRKGDLKGTMTYGANATDVAYYEKHIKDLGLENIQDTE